MKMYCSTYSSPETKLEKKHFNQVYLREAWEGTFDGAYNTVIETSLLAFHASGITTTGYRLAQWSQKLDCSGRALLVLCLHLVQACLCLCVC